MDLNLYIINGWFQPDSFLLEDQRPLEVIFIITENTSITGEQRIIANILPIISISLLTAAGRYWKGTYRILMTGSRECLRYGA